MVEFYMREVEKEREREGSIILKRHVRQGFD
jgi:hypothetical protein